MGRGIASALWYLAARLAGWNGSEAVQGDINGDGQIDFDDFYILSNAWLMTSDSPNWPAYADIDLQGGDGIINAKDFWVLGRAWNKAHPPEDLTEDVNRGFLIDIDEIRIIDP